MACLRRNCFASFRSCVISSYMLTTDTKTLPALLPQLVATLQLDFFFVLWELFYQPFFWQYWSWLTCHSLSCCQCSGEKKYDTRHDYCRISIHYITDKWQFFWQEQLTMKNHLLAAEENKFSDMERFELQNQHQQWWKIPWGSSSHMIEAGPRMSFQCEGLNKICDLGKSGLLNKLVQVNTLWSAEHENLLSHQLMELKEDAPGHFVANFFSSSLNCPPHGQTI